MKIVKLCFIACVVAGLSFLGCGKQTTDKSSPQAQPAAKATEPAKAVAAAPKAAEPNTGKQAADNDLKEIRTPDVVFWRTPVLVADKMLELAKVTKDDLLYDLGCGDGVIVIEAAKKYGCRCVGYDIDPERVKEARAKVDANGLGHLVRIEQKDIFTLDLSQANVITLYLLPSLNVKLIPQLEKLKGGSRIVSHDFDMEGVTPDQVVSVETPVDEHGTHHQVYLWTTPLKKEPAKK